MSLHRGLAGAVLCLGIAIGCRGNDRGLHPPFSGAGGAVAPPASVPEGLPTFPGYGGSGGGAPLDATATGDAAPIIEGGAPPFDARAPIADAAPTAGLPPAGNPEGKCALPADAALEDVSRPRTVVGAGTPASCTSDAFVEAVARGGVITFDCGPDPVTITLTRTARIVNDTGPKIVIDGGGKVTLSGGGKVRILYQNTCDEAQKWTTEHCDNQDHPQLTVQNLTFVDGNAQGQGPEGGGAILALGGRFKVINSRFARNACDQTGPVIAGGAVHSYGQFQQRPVYIVNSTFGGRDGLGNSCSNGGALGAVGVTYQIINSLFTHNRATGVGSLPPRAGTPGGGSGGAIYTDVGTFGLTVCGTRIQDNSANEGGGAIFFNSGAGTMTLRDSILSRNTSKGFETMGYPGIFVIARGNPQVTNTKFE
jgi:hypothetical protein